MILSVLCLIITNIKKIQLYILQWCQDVEMMVLYYFWQETQATNTALENWNALVAFFWHAHNRHSFTNTNGRIDSLDCRECPRVILSARCHDHAMVWKVFHITGLLWGEPTPWPMDSPNKWSVIQNLLIFLLSWNAVEQTVEFVGGRFDSTFSAIYKHTTILIGNL